MGWSRGPIAASSPINELPDLASKVQVGLFNILQEGDVQIKGYPVRLRLDVALVFSANPEDYTARGKIITPLKDRIGSEIRTHYPRTRHEAQAITSQEAWTDRTVRRVRRVRQVRRTGSDRDPGVRARDRRRDRVPGARRSEGRSPVGREPAAADHDARERRLQCGAAGARRTAKRVAVPRVADVYAALPSVTGKIELEYEGELKGAESVARELVRAAVATVFDGRAAHADVRPVIAWFENGGTLDLSDTSSAAELLGAVAEIDGFERGRRQRSAARRARANPPAPRSPTWCSKDCAR